LEPISASCCADATFWSVNSTLLPYVPASGLHPSRPTGYRISPSCNRLRSG